MGAGGTPDFIHHRDLSLHLPQSNLEDSCFQSDYTPNNLLTGHSCICKYRTSIQLGHKHTEIAANYVSKAELPQLLSSSMLNNDQSFHCISTLISASICLWHCTATEIYY